jgi:L-alanine-DL-glutamate epimerase-like enolase superfamily enzyme
VGWSPPPVEADIEACAAVRQAVGTDFTLMLDSGWSYSYPAAVKVGQAIEELGYYWYEDPLSADDIHGYVRLKQQLHIPLGDGDNRRRSARAAAVVDGVRHRLSPRRRGHQGRHHWPAEDRASSRSFPHELRSP